MMLQSVFSYSSIGDIALAVLLIVIAVFLTVSFISMMQQRKELAKRLEETEDSCQPPPAVITKATVLSKSAEYKGNVKSGEKITVYYMTFLKENGEKAEFTVNEDIFRSFEVSDEGNLVTVEDIMLDFYRDEESIE